MLKKVGFIPHYTVQHQHASGSVGELLPHDLPWRQSRVLYGHPVAIQIFFNQLYRWVCIANRRDNRRQGRGTKRAMKQMEDWRLRKEVSKAELKEKVD